ncbi:hypothetical protein AYL99_12073 [Fonsecaea erecta]|uniref:Orn/DAP/Arg decarboxylase 2 C-terminal domain-containing protein n=1 Tax=Fonsecaea erecta TaxID=1367422 RepID=A0A178Z1S0_9EURO|nr:hypothetical protein AYL99_12073 [Fonsecaea erecta]OAP53749.1 hypothetical protein AYL99_12073 [Fonsecaea erecta]
MAHLPFSFYGPTYDPDFMPGSFNLPADIEVGDYVEIVDVGAYGSTLRSSFNGFDTFETIILTE